GQDIVYHCISCTSPATSWKDPFVEIETNLKYSVHLFELAHQCGIKKIVFPSSGGTIYGRQLRKIREDNLPLPFNPYGITKLATEYFLSYFRERFGLAADVYRIGNAYGPRQPMDAPQGVIAVWMGKILAGQKITIFGDRNVFRDYVCVEDIARLVLHSLTDLSSSDTYNLGTGKGISILELFDIFKEVIDMPFKHEIFARRDFDNTAVVLDSSKLLSHFPGFKFQEIKKGISYTWAFVKEQCVRRKKSREKKRLKKNGFR
ncbi:MAG: NAD-dependent epimerase/dehydratase family protein, partial [Candidatus Omnitrophica bacterium]|nr:NAD-dependent epimerase/dehydratase family protein [Candidatus Omnitrophota bacterium]